MIKAKTPSLASVAASNGLAPAMSDTSSQFYIPVIANAGRWRNVRISLIEGVYWKGCGVGSLKRHQRRTGTLPAFAWKEVVESNCFASLAHNPGKSRKRTFRHFEFLLVKRGWLHLACVITHSLGLLLYFFNQAPVRALKDQWWCQARNPWFHLQEGMPMYAVCSKESLFNLFGSNTFQRFPPLDWVTQAAHKHLHGPQGRVELLIGLCLKIESTESTLQFCQATSSHVKLLNSL